jgi:hypothetical protein
VAVIQILSAGTCGGRQKLPPVSAAIDENKKGALAMQLTLKEIRHLAQSTQSIVTSVAIIATLVLGWQAFKVYREAQRSPGQTPSED